MTPIEGDQNACSLIHLYMLAKPECYQLNKKIICVPIQVKFNMEVPKDFNFNFAELKY